MGSAPTQRSMRGFDELLRGQLDAEQFVEASPSVGWLFHFKPSLQCRLLAPLRHADGPLIGEDRK